MPMHDISPEIADTIFTNLINPHPEITASLPEQVTTQLNVLSGANCVLYSSLVNNGLAGSRDLETFTQRVNFVFDPRLISYYVQQRETIKQVGFCRSPLHPVEAAMRGLAHFSVWLPEEAQSAAYAAVLAKLQPEVWGGAHHYVMRALSRLALTNAERFPEHLAGGYFEDALDTLQEPAARLAARGLARLGYNTAAPSEISRNMQATFRQAPVQPDRLYALRNLSRITDGQTALRLRGEAGSFVFRQDIYSVGLSLSLLERLAIFLRESDGSTAAQGLAHELSDFLGTLDGRKQLDRHVTSFANSKLPLITTHLEPPSELRPLRPADRRSLPRAFSRLAFWAEQTAAGSNQTTRTVVQVVGRAATSLMDFHYLREGGDAYTPADAIVRCGYLNPEKQSVIDTINEMAGKEISGWALYVHTIQQLAAAREREAQARIAALLL